MPQAQFKELISGMPPLRARRTDDTDSASMRTHQTHPTISMRHREIGDDDIFTSIRSNPKERSASELEEPGMGLLQAYEEF